MEEHATERGRTTVTRTASNKGRSSTGRRPSGKDVQEVEWQFDALGLEEVEEWLKEYGSGSDLSVAPGSTRELTDTYLDTEDWRLHRAGYALRVRRKGSNKTAEATMKSLVSTGSVSERNVRRREISECVRSSGIGFFSGLSESRGPVGERLRALAGSHEMRPLFEVRTHHQTFNLMIEEQEYIGTDGSSREIVQDAAGNIRRGSDGTHSGDVALDATNILFGEGEEPAHLSRVEVEVVEAEPPAAVFRFVKEMRRSLELDPTTVSKYEAGLSAASLIPGAGPEPGPTEIDASMNTGEVAFAILQRQFAAMRTHEPGARLGEDAEELHDMRVATRRMRAALKLFSDALPERAGHYREELKWIASALGEVRDLDVQIEQLHSLIAEAVEEYREALEDVVEALEERREEARERMLEALNSDRYERFVSSFAGMLRRDRRHDLEGDGYGESLADVPITAIAPDLFSRRHRKWRKAGKQLKKEPYLGDYHELRKEGKKLRYALEFLADVYGEKTTGKLVALFKELQDGLGRHQDSIVAADLLGRIVADGRKLSPRAAFEMGVFSERYLREALDLRASLPHFRPYHAMTKDKTWEGFEKAMEKQRKSVEKAGSGKKKAKAIGGKNK